MLTHPRRTHTHTHTLIRLIAFSSLGRRRATATIYIFVLRGRKRESDKSQLCEIIKCSVVRVWWSYKIFADCWCAGVS